MSWMDSWSRPSKHQATPAPLYLLPGGEETPYCKSCGRVISSRKSHATNTTSSPAKYCSSRCRSHKPGKLDRQIEDTFVGFLDGEEPLPTVTTGPAKQKKSKGDTRILVPCDAVEKVVFGDHSDPEKTFGRKRNRAHRGGAPVDDSTWKSVDMVSDNEDASSVASSAEDIDGDLLARMAVRSGTRIRPPQAVSQVNGSVGGEKGRAERIEETEEMMEKRKEGQKRAQEREMVRCAARRGVAFGFVASDTEQRRKCEAVMQGRVVESSFAKGEWSIRWRE